MTLVLMFLKSYWKHILIIVVLSVVSYIVYNKIYTAGYNAASAECAEKMKEYTEKLDSRIAGLEEASSTLVTEAIESRKSIKKDFNTILASIKNKPLYVVNKTGECAPSVDLVRVYNEAVDRANSR